MRRSIRRRRSGVHQTGASDWDDVSEPPRSLLEALFLASSQKPVNEAVEQVKRLSPQQQVDYILVLPALSDRTNQSMCSALCNAVELIRALLRRKLPIAPEQVVKMVELGADPSYYFPFSSVLRLAESIPMGPALCGGATADARVLCAAERHGRGHSAIKSRIDDLLHPKEAGAPFETAGSWSRSWPEATSAWRSVLEAGQDISGREPARKWREAASARVVAIGREQFRLTALRWLELGPSPGEPNVQTSTRESDYQRGLLWSLTQFADAEMAATVARFAEKCLRKIPSLGAVSQRSGNASVGVLAAMGGPESVAQLARLALRIRYHTARRLVQEALEEAARRQGLSREELEEITVPTFGLDGAGRRVERCGECFLVLNSGGELTCERADGTALKSLPEAVKRDFAEDLKELKQAAKEMAPLLQAHRVRLERLLLTERAIPLETWRSAAVFMLARPSAKSLPTILSQSMIRCMILPMNGSGPCIAQVTSVQTSVAPPFGSSVNSATLFALNGLKKSSLMMILLGVVSTISMRPEPTFLFPSQA